MADFDIDNPVFEPDDWEEDIGEDDVLSTSLHDPDVDDDGTSSSERVTIDGTSTSATLSLQQELLQTAVDDYYNAAAEAGLTPSLGRDPRKFELVDGQIRLKAYPNLDLVNKRSGRPLALSTLASRGGTKAIREDLDFADWAAKKSSLPAQAVEALQTTNLELGEAAAAVDSVELEDLGQTVTEVSDAIQRMETALTDTQIDEVLGTLDDPPHRRAPAWPTRWEIGPARGCISLKGRPSFSNLPHTGNNRQGIEWRHHVGREWAKKTLQALGRVLAKLAGKAAAALPGIIGSIVSWLLSTLGKAARWLAEHVWALAVAVGGLLFLAARELLAPHKWH